MRAIGLLLAAALLCGNGHAAVPHQLNYQGYLTAAGGSPVSATVSMALNLYDVSTGGATLYTETQTVPVTNGVFNVTIGSVTPLPLPFDVPYWLGVKVGSDAEMTPRQQVWRARMRSVRRARRRWQRARPWPDRKSRVRSAPQPFPLPA